MSTKVMTRQNEKNRNKIRTMAQIGMLSAIATVLMLFEIPLPFAPSFYEIDFSEVPILIGSFAMGPLAGAAIELIKILLNFAINGTMTAGVGEIANFLIGCSLVVPAALIYHKKHTRTGAVAGMPLRPRIPARRRPRVSPTTRVCVKLYPVSVSGRFIRTCRSLHFKLRRI